MIKQDAGCSITKIRSNMDKKMTWLKRRLKELGKTKQELADTLGIAQPRLSDYENGIWRFQAKHIKPTANFLEFDALAFLDFLSGNITEDELWNTTKDKVSLAFENNLRRIMKEKGITHQQLGTAIGLSGSAVSMMLNGSRKPSFESLVSICRELDTTPNTLMGFETDQDRKLLSMIKEMTISDKNHKPHKL